MYNPRNLYEYMNLYYLHFVFAFVFARGANLNIHFPENFRICKRKPSHRDKKVIRTSH